MGRALGRVQRYRGHGRGQGEEKEWGEEERVIQCRWGWQTRKGGLAIMTQGERTYTSPPGDSMVDLRNSCASNMAFCSVQMCSTPGFPRSSERPGR